MNIIGKPYNYDDFAEKYAHIRSAVPFVIDSLLKHLSLLKPGSVILEAGCGTGDHIIEVSKKYKPDIS